MAKKIISASVIGKSQNRTALGMMRAYLGMYPNSTLVELQAQFPKQKVCPDAGSEMDYLFYSLDELKKHEKKMSWYFTKGNELLTLRNGQKIAFCTMWTASSLQRLQSEMAKHQIHGEVDSSCKAANGYKVSYQYQIIDDKPQKNGIPAWIWLVGMALLIGLVYFVFQKQI